MARMVALPTARASVRIFFIRASGLKGFPFTMPTAANLPGDLGIHRIGRLRLHGLVQQFPSS